MADNLVFSVKEVIVALFAFAWDGLLMAMVCYLIVSVLHYGKRG
jgi:hypothetical protein